MLEILFAYCWASGLIEFGDAVPDDACCICHGPADDVRSFIEVTARHGHGKGVLLVPGVPEVESHQLKMDALLAHMDWLKKSVPPSVTMGARLDGIRPTSLTGLKRLAKQIRKARGIQHAEALEVAARQAGCTDFRAARRLLPAA